MEREHRRRFREIRRRRGQNVNLAPEVRAAWQRCRELSLGYLDAVVAAHAAGGPGAVAGFGKYCHLGPDEQAARQNLDHHDWVRQMEDTPCSRAVRRAGAPRGAGGEIFAAWGEYAFHARIQEEETNCAGFDVERARLYRAGAMAVGFDTRTAANSPTAASISGRAVEIVLPTEALRVLGQDFAFKHRLPKIGLETRLIPDWEYPGYWLTKDNREPSPAALAALLADHAGGHASPARGASRRGSAGRS